MRSFLMIRYVLGEMIPTFFLGVIVFVFILLSFQILRLTEFVLIHGVKISAVGMMMAYMSTSFLPILFPMSLLFAVLLTYARLSADSEIVAFKASGLSMLSIITPAVILSLLVGTLSLQTTFHIAPWGNRQFELLFTKLGSLKPGVILKEGTFSEGFFDLVVYANKVDATTGSLSQVFIYDERQADQPMTIIAKKGSIVADPDRPGHSAMLELNEGSIHRASSGRHTKIDFSKYQVFLSDPVTDAHKEKSPQSLSVDELQAKKKDPALKLEDRLELETEYHKRTAISFACILFALIGVGLGTVTNRRNAKGGGAVICIGLIVTYWIIFVTTEGAARQGQIPPLIAMWIPNMVFTAAAFFSLRRAWR
jgi:lipopolysaccharide export system permease protein